MISAIFSSENCIIYVLLLPFCTIRRYKRQKSQKGIRGPDTPPVKPSAWPAQPAGLTPRRRGKPAAAASPRACLAAAPGPLLRAVRGPPLALRVPSDTKKMGTGHAASHPHFLFARLRRIMSRDTYIIYKVGWVAYRTIFAPGALMS